MVRTNQFEPRGRQLQRVEWGVVFSLIVSSATAIFAGGIVYGQVQAQEVRLTKVEARADNLSTTLAAQAVMIARIDANVEFLKTEAKRRADRGE